MQATIQYIRKELIKVYPDSEINGFIRLIFESVMGWNYTEQVLRQNEKLDIKKVELIKGIVERLKMHEPIQYILGETEFYGLKIKVSPGVLIPRPETEELVQWIVESYSKDSPRILDIGTGSGCIPVALKNQIGNAEVSAIDISEKALEVAKENAAINNVDINFSQVDILKWEEYNWKPFDIIVSNPPYVRESEKKEMQSNVLIHEPDKALYVSNDDPLVFYRRIADFANKYLVENGKLFFEINEYLGDEMYSMLEAAGYELIELKKDIHLKDRMISCRKKNR